MLLCSFLLILLDVSFTAGCFPPFWKFKVQVQKLWKCSLIWVAFCTKLCLGISRHAVSFIFYVFISIYCFLCCISLIVVYGYIKTNPGQISSSEKCFSFCHWNLNCISAHNYVTAYTLFIVLMLFTFQRDIATLKLHLMNNVWNCQLIKCSVLITMPVIKENVLVFIINRPFFKNFEHIKSQQMYQLWGQYRQ